MRQIIKENDKYYLEVYEKLISSEIKKFPLKEYHVRYLLGHKFRELIYPYQLNEYEDISFCGFHEETYLESDCAMSFKCCLTNKSDFGDNYLLKSCPLKRKSCFIG